MTVQTAVRFGRKMFFFFVVFCFLCSVSCSQLCPPLFLWLLFHTALLHPVSLWLIEKENNHWVHEGLFDLIRNFFFFFLLLGEHICWAHRWKTFTTRAAVAQEVVMHVEIPLCKILNPKLSLRLCHQWVCVSGMMSSPLPSECVYYWK